MAALNAKESRVRRWCLAYAIGLAAWGLWLSLAWPIHKVDTDLWFHLSWGRELFEQGRIGSSSIGFSFLSPPRTWINYSWLFQALLYIAYQAAGYLGAIAFRSFSYLMTVGAVCLFLFQDRQKGTAWGWRLLLFGFLWMVLLPRHFQLRPFLMSNICLAAFLYIVECHPRRGWWLPVVAVLWCNLHGAMYPVLLLVAGAYSLEYLIGRSRGEEPDRKRQLQYFVPLMLSMLAIFATPHGVKLITVPMRELGYLRHFVSELVPFSKGNLFSFSLEHLVPSVLTVINLVLVLTLAALAVALWRRRARIAHLLLAAFSVWLFLKAPRFVPECALLALPLLRATPLWTRGAVWKGLSQPIGAVLLLLMLAVPLRFANAYLINRPTYPVSFVGLPEGVARFLLQESSGGKVLNFPNNGGYLRWRLSPTHKIWMDMEALFTDEDFHLAGNAFLSQRLMAEAIEEYQPDFIVAPIPDERVERTMGYFKEFVLVFFDDAEALYVDERRRPEMAASHRITEIDPFRMARVPSEELLEELSGKGLLSRLETMLEIYPGIGSLRRLAALERKRQGDREGALKHLNLLVQYYPESPEGYLLRGDLLAAMGRSEAARRDFGAAARMLPEESRGEAYQKIGVMFLDEGRYAEAYRFLRKKIDIFSDETSLETLHALATAARLSGESEVAKAALIYMERFRVGPGDTEWRDRIAQELAVLEPRGDGMKELLDGGGSL